jgi:hypothetical protein
VELSLYSALVEGSNSLEVVQELFAVVAFHSYFLDFVVVDVGVADWDLDQTLEGVIVD